MRATLITIIAIISFAGSSAFAIDQGTAAIGIDLSYSSYTYNREHKVQIEFPSQFRISVFTQHNFAVDFRIGGTFAATHDGMESQASMLFGISPYFHLGQASTVGFFEVLLTTDATGGYLASSQTGLGGSIGLQSRGHAFNPRFEIMVIRTLENRDNGGFTAVHLNLGLSFFSK